MNKKQKTLALVTVLCAPLLVCGLHDTQPWAGRPSINLVNGNILETGCWGSEKTAGGDREFVVTSSMYSFGPNVGYSHTYFRDMTMYDAPLDKYMTTTRNTYFFGPLRILRFDEDYSSVKPHAR